MNSLPEDIIIMISEKLESLVDIVNLSATCKKLNRICKEIKCENTEIYNIKSKYRIDEALNFNNSSKLFLKMFHMKLL